MEHAQAKSTGAAERYLLNEMEQAEADAFEDHFFDCTECAADVRDGARMLAAGREIVREEQQATKVADIRSGRRFRGWLPQAAAASILSASLGWYGAVALAPRGAAVDPQPEIVAIDNVTEIAFDEQRGPGEPPPQLAAGEPGVLNFFVPETDAERLVITVRDAAGTSRYSTVRPNTTKPVSLVLRALPRGSYSVVIEGVRKDGNRFPVKTSEFEVN